MTVDHDDQQVAAALHRYLAALDDGRSVLVRPQGTYPGMDRVVVQVSALVDEPLLVTDLHGAEEVADTDRTSASELSGPVLAFHTSGSTGTPKCVVYEVATVRAHAARITTSLDLSSAARYMSLVPVGFAYGLSIVHSHAWSGVDVRFVAGIAADDLADLLATECNVLYLLPQQASLLLTASGIRPAPSSRIIVAGGRLSGAAAAALADRYPGLQLTNMYGQAEMGPRLAVWQGPVAEFVEGNIGRPLPGVRLELSPPNGAGQSSLLASTDHAMAFVIAPPYDEVQRGPAPGEQVVTGDLASLRPDGDLIHHGRADLVANVAGTKVDLRELADHVEDRFATIAVRVTTRPSRVTGDSLPVIHIVPCTDANYSAADVRRALRETWGSLATLAVVELVDHLALGEAGK
jgi:acyl-coenzyme A synthetase/AMP-(fatty) acid ligase